MEHGPTACDAPTIQEQDLQAAVVQAINLTLGNRENMMVTLQENIEAVIRQEDETSSEGIEAKLAYSLAPVFLDFMGFLASALKCCPSI